MSVASGDQFGKGALWCVLEMIETQEASIGHPSFVMGVLSKGDPSLAVPPSLALLTSPAINTKSPPLSSLSQHLI